VDSDRQTFIDPETGEEIESTALATATAWLLLVLLPPPLTAILAAARTGLVAGGAIGFTVAAVFALTCGPPRLWWSFVAICVVSGVVVALLLCFVTDGLSWLVHGFGCRPLSRSVHDAIARWQHQRRKQR
jgi:cation transporter-like permease